MNLSPWEATAGKELLLLLPLPSPWGPAKVGLQDQDLPIGLTLPERNYNPTKMSPRCSHQG